MNIKILDSWLRDYLKTNAQPQKIAEIMSLTSVSIERIEKYKNDYLYDIEVTTNRPDLMSVVGLAREAATVLSQAEIQAEFVQPVYQNFQKLKDPVELSVNNTTDLVHRVCAVVMDVKLDKSPEYLKDRLESSDIRSLNNLIDITNYIMRTVGHPTHVFDYDRIINQSIKIRTSKKGESITTLDGKKYTLPGGDIIAEDGSGRIIDLLAIMGLENSVVTEETKRIILFIDNNEPSQIRKTSMSLAIRTEAAQLEEKGVDPELAMDALLYGIELYQKLANGKIVSNIIDIYPNPYKEKSIQINEEKIQQVIGVPIDISDAVKILHRLDFKTNVKGKILTTIVPSFRANDMEIPEDLVEEIARIYGYQNIPSNLPPLENNLTAKFSDEFYWENKIKTAFKYWGFTEVYTYSMVSEKMYEGNINEAVTINNPLIEELVYMRKTLVPSLLQVVSDNPTYDELKIFELANVYVPQQNNLPDEKLHLAGVIKQFNNTFFVIKGIFEQLAEDLGIEDLNFKFNETNSIEMTIANKPFGTLEKLASDLYNFECDFKLLIQHATVKKTFTPIAKYPPIIEDMAFIFPDNITVKDAINVIKKQSNLISNVQLYDKYKDLRTFRIYYQHKDRNLTSTDVAPIREKIVSALKERDLILK